MSGPRLAAVDSSPWIVWVEADPALLAVVEPLFEEIELGRVHAVSSTIVLLEVLTGAFRRGNDLLARRFEEVFGETRGVALLPVTREIAREAARLRAAHGLRTPDSIHVATAIVAGAAEFVTMDRRLARVKEIPVRVLRPAAPKRPRR
ncbi:MAG TPA: PIN domain-containing protein [Thermoanaerobaculia bacterium]|nr:PIN domain-containing protein [Thermoanaerobaculia bacterium]